jgi:hypothetical protein
LITTRSVTLLSALLTLPTAAFSTVMVKRKVRAEELLMLRDRGNYEEAEEMYYTAITMGIAQRIPL